MKWVIYIGAAIGGLIGGCVPIWLWHASALSMTSLVGSSIGGLVGLVVAIKLGKSLGY